MRVVLLQHSDLGFDQHSMLTYFKAMKIPLTQNK